MSYNAVTKELTWNIGSIPKGTSLTSSPRSVSFQVGFTPSLSQVGTTPVLVNDMTLTGHDDFANVDVNLSKSAIRTSLENDPALPAGGGSVAN